MAKLKIDKDINQILCWAKYLQKEKGISAAIKFANEQIQMYYKKHDISAEQLLNRKRTINEKLYPLSDAGSSIMIGIIASTVSSLFWYMITENNPLKSIINSNTYGSILVTIASTIISAIFFVVLIVILLFILVMPYIKKWTLSNLNNEIYRFELALVESKLLTEHKIGGYINDRT